MGNENTERKKRRLWFRNSLIAVMRLQQHGFIVGGEGKRIWRRICNMAWGQGMIVRMVEGKDPQVFERGRESGEAARAKFEMECAEFETGLRYLDGTVSDSDEELVKQRENPAPKLFEAWCTACGKTFARLRDVPPEWQCECGGLVVDEHAAARITEAKQREGSGG